MSQFKLFLTAVLFSLFLTLTAKELRLSVDLPSAKAIEADVLLKIRNGQIRIDYNKNANWPNVRFLGEWDFSPYADLVATIKNTSASPICLEWRINNPGGTWEKDSKTVKVSFKAGEEKVIRMCLTRKASSLKEFYFHGMKAIPAGMPSQKGADMSNITSMQFILPRSKAERSIVIKSMVAQGVYKPFKVAGEMLPLVDKFGQYRHADWPGKVKSDSQLREITSAELRELKETPVPKGWNKYGGWAAGPQLKGTGHFRIEKYKGKWSLVDPDGRLFFSNGINHVNIAGIHSSTSLFRRKGWFEKLPSPNSPRYQQFYFVRKIYTGDYSGNYSPGFTFIGYNLFKKFGSNWKKIATNMALRRLRSWGFNTIANWSDYAVYRTHQLPYTVGIAMAGSGARIIGGGKWRVGSVWDVYDTKFRDHVDQRVSQLKRISASSWCIGIFFDNELSWGNYFPQTVITSQPDEPAKKAFVKMLKDKYGQISGLNKQWGSNFGSWNQLLKNRKTPNQKKATADMDAFYLQTARVYYKTIRDSIRKYCPGKLYLGSRFASSQCTPLTVRAAADYCDVISFNIYYRTLKGFLLKENIDAPIMSTEFHFGAKDCGMFGPGLVPVKNQRERAEAYKKYVESALRHPLFVGCHWFQYYDQPFTGRIFDGENHNIGFLNVADVPYRDMVKASRDVAKNMYELRFGN